MKHHRLFHTMDIAIYKTKKPPNLGGFNIFNSENYSNNVNGLSKYVLNVCRN